MLLEKERERDKKNCKRREKRKNENLVFDVTFFDRRRRFLENKTDWKQPAKGGEGGEEKTKKTA